MRNALSYVPKGQNTVVAAAIRQVFLQPDQKSATQVWRQVADQLRTRWPKLGACMDEAETDVLAYTGFSTQHRTKLHSRMRWTRPALPKFAMQVVRGRLRGEERNSGRKFRQAALS